MGIDKKIYEHNQIDCSQCSDELCERTSEDIVKCMDRKYDMGTYNQDHLSAIREAVRKKDLGYV